MHSVLCVLHACRLMKADELTACAMQQASKRLQHAAPAAKRLQLHGPVFDNATCSLYKVADISTCTGASLGLPLRCCCDLIAVPFYSLEGAERRGAHLALRAAAYLPSQTVGLTCGLRKTVCKYSGITSCHGWMPPLWRPMHCKLARLPTMNGWIEDATVYSNSNNKHTVNL